jgi:hypothetical protein
LNTKQVGHVAKNLFISNNLETTERKRSSSIPRHSLSQSDVLENLLLLPRGRVEGQKGPSGHDSRFADNGHDQRELVVMRNQSVVGREENGIHERVGLNFFAIKIV